MKIWIWLIYLKRQSQLLTRLDILRYSSILSDIDGNGLFCYYRRMV